MPAITNIYKSIKTTKALEYLQDMVVTGNELKLLGFSVASQNGALDPDRTLKDIYPTWYPTSGQYTAFSIAPANVGTTLSFVMDIPSAVTNDEVYITEIYIYAEYKGETFLFGICQTQVDPPTYRYIPNTGYTQTCSFDLTQYEGNLNIIINQVSGISLNKPLYVDVEGNISLQYDETLTIGNDGLGVSSKDLISKDSGNRLGIGEDGKLFTKGGGAEGDLGGRVSNAIDTFEVSDIDFENIPKGYVTESVETPALASAVTQTFGTEGIFTYKMNTTSATNNANAYLFTKNSRWEADTGLGSPAIGFNIEYCFPKAMYAEKLYWRHGDAGTANNNMKSCDLAYSDDGVSWTTFQSVSTNTNALGTYFTFDIKPEMIKQNGSHRYWSCRNIKMYENSSSFNVNLIQWSGEAYTITDTTSLGYIAVGDLQLTNNGRYITGFNDYSYLISKYIVENWESYEFRIAQTFTQVSNLEPIISFPNSTQALYIEGGKLKLLRNKVEYEGVTRFTYNQYYFFKIVFDSKKGYTIQSSTDNLNWTTEIYLNDESNFIRNKTMYLGCLASDITFIGTSGSIDLDNTGFYSINGERQIWTYPINEPFRKDCSIIQVTFEGNGLMANGRTFGGMLDNREWLVNTKNNTIIYSEGNDTLVFDKSNGLTCVNYEEFNYAVDDDISDDQTVAYEKDVNKTFRYSIIYPNFLQRGLKYEIKDTQYKDENVTPVLSSNEQSGFVVADSRNNTDIYTVFNGTTTKKIGDWSTYSIQEEFPSKFMSRSYSITADNSTSPKYPTAWRYEGSNDQVKWSILDSRAGETFASGQEKNYTFENINSYKYYRLTFLSGITSNNNGELGRVQFLGTLISPETDTETIVLDFSDPEAVFAPNKFLKANEFNFTLRLNYTGNLSLVRKFDYSSYNQASNYTTYVNQLACSWSDFSKYVDDSTLEIPNGVQFSSYDGDTYNLTALGTEGAIGNISKISTASTDYANPHKTLNNPSTPGFVYFAFNKPVHFNNFLTTNYSTKEHSNNKFSLDVSNDFQNWVSTIPTTAKGYNKNLGGLPIPNMPTTNSEVNASYTMDISFPNNGYYKYVRLGIQNTNETIRSIIRGFWLGGNNAIIANSETLKELVLDDVPFLNDGEDGISLNIVKAEDFKVYQVQFEDQLGYVKVEGSENKLVPQGTPVYADVNCTQQLGTMTQAYEVNCKQWLRNYIDQSLSKAIMGNPMSTKVKGDYVPIVMVDCDTGTATNCWNAFWDTTTSYDFANGVNRTNFTMKFHERCIVEEMKFRNYDGNGYSPEDIWIEGSNDAYTSENPTWENVLGYENFVKTSYSTNKLNDDNGIITGFKDRTYVAPAIKCTYSQWDSWEWQLKIKTPVTFTGGSSRILATQDESLPMLIGNLSTGIFRIYLGASSWNIASDARSTKALAVDTWYWLKMTFTGEKYILSVSTDGKNYETYYSIDSTVKLIDNHTNLMGSYADDVHSAQGYSLDLNDCRLIVNGEKFWEPYVRNQIEKVNLLTTWASTMYSIKLRTDKSYSYYRVGMQRGTNRILMQLVSPRGVWIDPVNKQTRSVLTWKDDFTEIGNDRPLRHMMYPVTSSDSAIPIDNSPIGVASSTKGTTAWNCTQFGTDIWDTVVGDSNKALWFSIWQFAPYPFRIAMWQQFTHSNANYISQNLEIYGTNLNDSFAHNTINDTYHRIANLKTTADFATSLLSNNAVNTYYETYLTDNSSHIGYRYNKTLINRLTNQYPVIREMNLYKNTTENKIIPMYYTHEWKWTNIAGAKGSIHKLGAYDDPFLIPGTSSTVTPSYRVVYNDETRWVPISGSKGDYVDNNYGDIYGNWSLVGNKTPKNIWAYELKYTDSKNDILIAYTPTKGETSSFLENNTKVYLDMDFENPFILEYAYEVTYNDQTGYTKVSGTAGKFAPEGTQIYSDPEFTTELIVALVDNWAYNGVVHKKYQYSGTIEKKWRYTGDVDNQYVYTGNVEGWKYTGKTEVAYSSSPNIMVTFNRANTRRVTKQIQVGISYPISTSESPNTTIGYLYDTSGTVGNFCPVGLTYYTNAQDGVIAGTTDGTQIFQTAIGVNRYTYDYKFLPNTGEADGVMIGSGQIMYYDQDLTKPTDPVQIDSTGYYWDTPTYISKLGSVDFPIPESASTDVVYNYKTVGTVINNKGVLSGFSDSSYVQPIPQWKTPSTSMELVFKVNANSFASTRNDIISSVADKQGMFLGCVKDTGALVVFMSNNNTAWDIMDAYNPGLTLSLNTDYFVKITWNGTQYDFAISTDDSTWQTGTPVVSNLSVNFSNTLNFGSGANVANSPWGGTIDLNQSYLDIDGERFWSGVTQPSGLVENKKLEVSYNSEKYSVTYDNKTKEIVTGEYIKNSTFQFGSQDLVKLNLSKSTFSWWTWNGLITQDVEKSQQWLFRIANVEGSPGSIEDIRILYPWKVGDGGSGSNIYTINSVGKKKAVNQMYIADGTDSINTEEAKKLIAKGKNVMALNVPGALMAVGLNPSGKGTDKTFSNGGNVICYSPTTLNIITGTTATFTGFVGVMGIPAGYRVTSTSAFYWSE